MAYTPKNKAAGSKPAYGTKKTYTPTLKDGFNNFMISLLRVPFSYRGSTWTPEDVTVKMNKLEEHLERTEGALVVRDFIRIWFGVTKDDEVEDGIGTIFNGQALSLEYALNSFEKENANNKNEGYKAAGDSLVEVGRNIEV